MTAHQYLSNLLVRQAMLPADLETLRRIRGELEVVLRRAYGSGPRIYYGGSFAKGTMIRSGFDLDVVIYFPLTYPGSLRDIFGGVAGTLRSAGYRLHPKNVAVRLPYQGGFHVDVVPGRAQDQSFKYATLYKSEEDSTRQTSIKVHIDSVKGAGVAEVVKVMKIWRHVHNLDWSSFALEQIVIRALASRRKDDLGAAVWAVFQYLVDNIQSIRLVDPANSNNFIEVSADVRASLYQRARSSLAQQHWDSIVW